MNHINCSELNINQLEERYHSIHKEIASHQYKYDDDMCELEIDLLDGIADGLYGELQTIINAVRSYILLNLLKDYTEDEIKTMFIINEDKAMDLGFNIIKKLYQ